MDMVRGFVGFVMGVVVMGAVFFTGALDGIPHWWARNVTHRGDVNYDPDPEHARYTISAIYQPANNGGAICEPRYEFVNHTSRTVKFLPDGYDDSAYGNQNTYGGPPPASGYVSTTPPSNSGAQGYDPQNHGPSNYDRQSYGSQTPGQQGYGDQDYGDRGYDSQQDYSGDSGDDPYNDDYPGESDGGGCNAGVVQIILDRKK